MLELVCLFVYWYVCLFVYLFVCLSVYLFVCLFITVMFEETIPNTRQKHLSSECRILFGETNPQTTKLEMRQNRGVKGDMASEKLLCLCSLFT